MAQISADIRQRRVDRQGVEGRERHDQQDCDGDETVFGGEQPRRSRRGAFVGHEAQSCRHLVVVRARGLLRCRVGVREGAQSDG